MKKLIALFTLSLMIASCGNYGQKTSSPGGGTNSGTGTGTKGSTDLDFATIRTTILEPQCISCHTGRHSAYASYEIVKASAFAILERMDSDNPSRRMPKDAPPLSNEAIEMFREWVNAGAPEFKEEPGEKPTKPDKPKEANISFLEIKNKVLKPYNCTSCHSQFNDYEPVKLALGSIASLVTSDKMPFPKTKTETAEPVSAEGKDLLLKWVSQGAPEFSDAPAATVKPPEKISATYVSIRNNILGPKCVLCHNSFGNRGAGLNLDSFLEIRKAMAKNAKLIQVNSPNDSHLIGAMIGRVDEDELFFDPMPYNNSFDDVQGVVPPVTDKEVEIIEKWIELNLPYSEDEI